MMDYSKLDKRRFERDTKWLASKLRGLLGIELDDVQQTYIEHWLALPDLPVPYACVATLNNTIKTFRSQQWSNSRSGTVLHIALDDIDYSLACDDHLDERMQVQQLLSFLTPSDRVLLSKYFAGYKIRELGAELGVSHTTISNRLGKIMNRLKRIEKGKEVR